MTNCGVLFLGGAKRVSMARHFKKSASEMGLQLNLYSYELSHNEPISVEASVIQGLKWSDANVLEDIHNYVLQYDVKIIIPFVDGAIAIATAYRDKYKNVFVPAGSTAGINAMFDKVVAADVFKDAGLTIPETVSMYDGRELIAKPRQGSASQGIVYIKNAEAFNTLGEGYLVQEYIHGREWTVDCYRRVDNGYIECISPRTRDRVAGGEVIETTVHPNATEIIDATRPVLERLDLRGAVTVQFIEGTDGIPRLMEVNPRLGGGAVAAIAAGINIPRLILSEAMGKSANQLQIPKSVIVKRYMEEVVFPL